MAITTGECKRALTKKRQGKKLTARENWVLERVTTPHQERRRKMLQEMQRKVDAENGQRRSQRLKTKKAKSSAL